VRIDRREPPAPEPAAGVPDRREADEQLSARLVALQMAVAGGARGEVEVHLQRTFDLEDLTSILDDVFGQGTDADKRVAWPRPAGGAAQRLPPRAARRAGRPTKWPRTRAAQRRPPPAPGSAGSPSCGPRSPLERARWSRASRAASSRRPGSRSSSMPSARPPTGSSMTWVPAI